ncbi:AGAP013505-PA [Anopheles gambiae str. PEST]|uniref:AGAP013505-PA n=1 Tax=Anopheles gambiae TaxID=7165 RepID=F5HKA1_ANOGA|nr:AGAP013505-PA [Anopheles gambiae str. PEST]
MDNVRRFAEHDYRHLYLVPFSLVVSKPFLGDLLARAIASSSTPDDPQSHITDFRMMMKMDKKADKLQLIDTKANNTQQSPEEEPPITIANEQTTTPATTTTLWQRWNRTDLLARIIDDIIKPAQERITLVFQTLVPKNGAEELDKMKQFSTNDDSQMTSVAEHPLNATADNNDSDELDSDLEPLQHDSDSALFDRGANGTTLLGQFQARRKVLRRRVAKALSSITGLLILAANTRREGNSRSTRSITVASDGDDLSGREKRALVELPPNVVDPYADYTEALLAEDSGADTEPRRNMETVGIFLLEVLGSFAGFSWGIFKTAQSFFSYAIS